jgi:hypothetical protein
LPHTGAGAIVTDGLQREPGLHRLPFFLFAGTDPAGLSRESTDEAALAPLRTALWVLYATACLQARSNL